MHGGMAVSREKVTVHSQKTLGRKVSRSMKLDTKEA